MHKNPSTALISDEDYLRWSKKCLKEANAYFEVSHRCKDMIFSEHSNAVLTNVSFACELYLKYLLLIRNVDCRSEHNLYSLFKKLPLEARNELKGKHPCGNILNTEFEQNLRDIGSAYTIFRYMYEKGNMAYNLQFLLELLWTLYDIAFNNTEDK
jgi:HEPN domain-containing protein